MPLFPGVTPDSPSSSRPLRGAGFQPALLLVSLCLVVYVPGFFTIPPVDRDESRFAQASRQMFESVALPAAAQAPAFHDGGLLIPKIQDRPRLNKPPLIYWLQAASAAVFTAGNPLRDAIWMYRIPSLLAAIAVVFITWRLGASMYGPRVGLLAGALLAVCPIVAWEAHQARADMLLLAMTTATMAALWHIWRRAAIPDSAAVRARLSLALLFWLLLCAGILTKGPITPLVAALTALALSITTRRWRWLMDLRPALGLLILAASITPWVYLVAQKVGPDVYFRTVLDETLGRSLRSKEGHWAPPGYHLILLSILFWPGCLLTAAGIAHAFRHAFIPGTAPAPSRLRLLRRGDPASPDLFLLSWVAPSWLLFELIGTKLPHYTLPLYPALAIVSARAVMAAASGEFPIRRVALIRVPWILIGVVVCIGLPIGCWLTGVRDSAWIIPLGVVWGVALGYWVRYARGSSRHAESWMSSQRAGIIAMAATALFLFQALLPATKRLWLSARITELTRPLDPDLARPFAAVGYHEDSLIFLRRARIDRINADDLDRWLVAHPGGLLVAPTALIAARSDLHEVASIRGYNYTTGRRLELSIAEPRP